MSVGVEHVDGVCGGRAVLVGTRMPIWVLSRLTRQEARTFYPHLSDAQLDAAIEYARAHPDEMARDIADQQEDV